MKDGKETVNVKTLPRHTRIETICGLIGDCKRGKIDGFTKSSLLAAPKPYGYMVGLGGDFDAAKLSYEEIRGKVNILFQESIGKADLFIGGWNYEGATVVELSEWIPTLEAAIFAGKLRKQISIWDISEGAEIKMADVSNE